MPPRRDISSSPNNHFNYPDTPTSASIYLSPSNLSPLPFSPSSSSNSDLYPLYALIDLCQNCKSPLTAPHYCQKCTAEHLKKQFTEWTSGNVKIDAIIRESQVTATNHEELIEWISFDRFREVTYIAQGGFGKVYSAIWIDGPIAYWDKERGEWLRRPQYKVALKVSKNKEDGDFLHEFESQRSANKTGPNSHVLWFMGITKDPSIQTYMLVMPFAQYGDLRYYIHKNYAILTWPQRLRILYYISKGLSNIHDAGIIHKDFHTGNILQLSTHHSYIGDLGLSEPVDTPSPDQKKILVKERLWSWWEEVDFADLELSIIKKDFMLVEEKRIEEFEIKEQLNQSPSSNIDFVHPQACYSSRLLPMADFCDSSKNEDEYQDFIAAESRENDNLINWNERVSGDYINSEHEQHSSSSCSSSKRSTFSSDAINSNNLTQIPDSLFSLKNENSNSTNSGSSSKNNSNILPRKSSVVDMTLRREREITRLEKIDESPIMENYIKSQAIKTGNQTTGITTEFSAFEILRSSSKQFHDPDDSEEDFEENFEENFQESLFSRKDSFGSNDKLYTPILPPGVRESQHTGLTPEIGRLFSQELFPKTKEITDFTAGSLYDFELMSPPPSHDFDTSFKRGGVPKERWRNFDISMEHFSSGRVKRSHIDSDGESNKVNEEVRSTTMESFVISSPVGEIGRPDSRY
ncbi:14116_t:CDS:2, partial [Ambispora leptoticha]